MKNYIIRFAALFIIIFIAHSLISISDDINSIFSNKSFIHGLRITFGSLVFVNSLFLFFICFFTDLLPLKLFFPIIFYNFIIFLIKTPLYSYVISELNFHQLSSFTHINLIYQVKWYGALLIVFSLIQCALGLFVYYKNKKVDYTHRTLKFDAVHALKVFTFLTVIIFVSVYPYFMLNVTTRINTLTNGFMHADFKSLYSIEKIYSKGKTDVSLVGMIHIGESTFYKSVLKSFNTDDTIVLTEGISDSQNRLKIKPTYQKISEKTGLSSQAKDFVIQKEKKYTVKNVDIDTSEFSNTTINIINKILYMLDNISDLKKFLKLQQETEQYLIETRGWSKLEEDILKKRNKKIMLAIDKYKSEFNRIVVPWGAYHLNEIEQYLLDNGYSQTNSIKRTVFNFDEVFSNALKKKQEEKINE